VMECCRSEAKRSPWTPPSSPWFLLSRLLACWVHWTSCFPVLLSPVLGVCFVLWSCLEWIKSNEKTKVKEDQGEQSSNLTVLLRADGVEVESWGWVSLARCEESLSCGSTPPFRWFKSISSQSRPVTTWRGYVQTAIGILSPHYY